jgi:hypothetical protein
MQFLSRRCEVCGTYLGRFDRSCKWCAALGREATRLSRWSPRVGEVAVRFDLKKPRRSLGAGLVVERGQAAILSLAGRIAVTLQPGPYRFNEGMLKDIVSLGAAGRMALTFVVTSDIELRFAFEDLLTRDHLPVSGSGSMVVRVALADFVGGMGAFELDSGLSAKQRLATVLERDLTPTLDAQGLEFVALRAAEFRQEGLLLERKALGEALRA